MIDRRSLEHEDEQEREFCREIGARIYYNDFRNRINSSNFEKERWKSDFNIFNAAMAEGGKKLLYRFESR